VAAIGEPVRPATGRARRVRRWLLVGVPGQPVGFQTVSLYELALARRAQGDLAGAAGHLKEGMAVAAEAGDGTSSRIGDAAFEDAQAWGGSAGSRRAVKYALEQA